MAAVTLNGPMGAGGREVGLEVARLLDYDYVDRLVLAEAAKRIGASVQVLEIKERQPAAFREKLAMFLRTMLERSAMSGAGGEPYFGPGMEYLPSEEYTDLAPEPQTAAIRLHDQQFIDATQSVIQDLAKSGSVVINGRGSNMILQDEPGVMHVGLTAPMETRMNVLMNREGFSRKEAEKYISDMDKAMTTYFRRFFKSHQLDPNNYHLVLNMGALTVQDASEMIVNASRKIVTEAPA